METVETAASGCRYRRCSIRRSSMPAIGSAFAKLDPRALIKNPVMFVVEVVAALTTVHLPARPRHRRRRISASRSRSSSGCGSRCCSPISPKPSPKAAARRRPSRCGRPAPRRQAKLLTAADRERLRAGARHRASKVGDVVLVEAGDIIPSRRRSDRGRRLGQRGRDHRRIRAGHPRIRRRPLGGHRRHAGAVRLDPRAHHRGAGLDLPRPHDRAGRGRRAAEDAERDRAQHPARRPDHHLRVRDRRPSRASPPMPAARSRSSCWWRCSSR